MRVYNQTSSVRPVRLSYHFQSHYNAIVDPTSSSATASEQAALVPGVVEDNHLHTVRASMANDANSGARTSAKVERESGQLGTALALSRREFQGAQGDEFEQTVAMSLREFDSAEDSALAAAKTESLRATQEAKLLDAAKRESENLYLAQQMSQLSVSASQADMDSDAEMKRALALSQRSELNRALELSRADQKHDGASASAMPRPVQACLDLGFSEQQVMQAWSIFGTDPSVDQTLTTQRMTEFLMSA
jgi:hypothetical protein